MNFFDTFVLFCFWVAKMLFSLIFRVLCFVFRFHVFWCLFRIMENFHSSHTLCSNIYPFSQIFCCSQSEKLVSSQENEHMHVQGTLLKKTTHFKTDALEWHGRGGFRGGACRQHPSIFCRDRAPDFVWAPQVKRMHQIVRIDSQN